MLWITDQGQRAGELLAGVVQVLAWLHEHNRDQDFSGVRYACENMRNWTGITWRRSTADMWGFPGIF